MSAWRTRAIELFPDLRLWLQEARSVYEVFFHLLLRCEESHERSDTKKLEKIYEYAEWCLRQEDHDLSNAAAVAFYEHLGDSPVTYAKMHKWVKPDIFKQIVPLLDLTDEQIDMIKQQYEKP